MQARSAAQQPLQGGAVGPPVQGVVQVDAYCGLPEGLPALTQLLGDALKGTLLGCPRPLQVSHPSQLSLPSHNRFHEEMFLQDLKSDALMPCMP